VAQLTATQQAWRGRIEAGIRLAQPFLDMLLVAGDRVSRAVDRDELDQAGPLRPVRRAERTSLAPGRDGDSA
jgi:hypothetical protein